MEGLAVEGTTSPSRAARGGREETRRESERVPSARTGYVLYIGEARERKEAGAAGAVLVGTLKCSSAPGSRATSILAARFNPGTVSHN